jgi:hypothetical protein
VEIDSLWNRHHPTVPLYGVFADNHGRLAPDEKRTFTFNACDDRRRAFATP